MLIYACIFDCLDPVLTIAATLAGRSPFLHPIDADENEVFTAHNYFASNPIGECSDASREMEHSGCFFSDHLSAVTAYDRWIIAKAGGDIAAERFCKRYFLSINTLEDIRQLRELFRLICFMSLFYVDLYNPI